MLRAAAIATVVVTSACSHEPVRSMSDAAYSDSADAPADPLPAWGAPVPVFPSSGLTMDDPSFTEDLLELYLGAFAASDNEDIIVARRATLTSSWDFQAVQGLNTNFQETGAHVTADGLGIYFASDRMGSNFDLYFASRASRTSPWSQPQRIDPVSTVARDSGPSVDPAQLRLVWCAGEAGGAPAIFVSQRENANEPWAPPTHIPSLDASAADDCDPMEVGPTTIYFASARLDALGLDIFVASRASPSEPYGTPTRIDEVSVEGARDRDPWVSADQRLLVFTSDRHGTDQLFMSTR